MHTSISGRRYNTETAKLVKTMESSEKTTSPFWYSVALYRKPGGEYFVHGVGNELTLFGRPSYNRQVNGERIIPISVEVAEKLKSEVRFLILPVPSISPIIGGDQ